MFLRMSSTISSRKIGKDSTDRVGDVQACIRPETVACFMKQVGNYCKVRTQNDAVYHGIYSGCQVSNTGKVSLTHFLELAHLMKEHDKTSSAEESQDPSDFDLISINFVSSDIIVIDFERCDLKEYEKSDATGNGEIKELVPFFDGEVGDTVLQEMQLNDRNTLPETEMFKDTKAVFDMTGYHNASMPTFRSKEEEKEAIEKAEHHVREIGKDTQSQLSSKQEVRDSGGEDEESRFGTACVPDMQSEDANFSNDFRQKKQHSNKPFYGVGYGQRRDPAKNPIRDNILTRSRRGAKHTNDYSRGRGSSNYDRGVPSNSRNTKRGFNQLGGQQSRDQKVDSRGDGRINAPRDHSARQSATLSSSGPSSPASRSTYSQPAVMTSRNNVPSSTSSSEQLAAHSRSSSESYSAVVSKAVPSSKPDEPTVNLVSKAITMPHSLSSDSVLRDPKARSRLSAGQHLRSSSKPTGDPQSEVTVEMTHSIAYNTPSKTQMPPSSTCAPHTQGSAPTASSSESSVAKTAHHREKTFDGSRPSKAPTTSIATRRQSSSISTVEPISTNTVSSVSQNSGTQEKLMPKASLTSCNQEAAGFKVPNRNADPEGLKQFAENFQFRCPKLECPESGDMERIQSHSSSTIKRDSSRQTVDREENVDSAALESTTNSVPSIPSDAATSNELCEPSRSMEHMKTRQLNPEAPEFVPHVLRSEVSTSRTEMDAEPDILDTGTVNELSYPAVGLTGVSPIQMPGASVSSHGSRPPSYPSTSAPYPSMQPQANVFIPPNANPYASNMHRVYSSFPQGTFSYASFSNSPGINNPNVFIQNALPGIMNPSSFMMPHSGVNIDKQMPAAYGSPWSMAQPPQVPYQPPFQRQLSGPSTPHGMVPPTRSNGCSQVSNSQVPGSLSLSGSVSSNTPSSTPRIAGHKKATVSVNGGSQDVPKQLQQYIGSSLVAPQQYLPTSIIQTGYPKQQMSYQNVQTQLPMHQSLFQQGNAVQSPAMMSVVNTGPPEGRHFQQIMQDPSMPTTQPVHFLHAQVPEGSALANNSGVRQAHPSFQYLPGYQTMPSQGGPFVFGLVSPGAAQVNAFSGTPVVSAQMLHTDPSSFAPSQYAQ